MIKPLSPLQRVKLEGSLSPIFLKREDLLKPGGGNKVRRFQGFFKKYSQVQRVVALSDPGSHTFKILACLINEMKEEKAPNLIFLERSMVLSDYQQRNREMYIENSAIQVSTKPFWLQWMRWMYYKYMIPSATTRVIGIGGYTFYHPNPFKQAFKECEQQLIENGVTGPVVHLFPIASGQMLNGFLAAESTGYLQSTFVGVMTGDSFTHRYLGLKYGRQSAVHLLLPSKLKDEEKGILAEQFHSQTGVWLDPIHTIHLLAVLEKETERLQSKTIVMWITCPYLTESPYHSNPKGTGIVQ